MLLDKLVEEGQVGKVEFVADFLDRLVAVTQLLADSAHSGLVYQVKGRTARLAFQVHVLHTGEVRVSARRRRSLMAAMPRSRGRR